MWLEAKQGSGCGKAEGYQHDDTHPIARSLCNVQAMIGQLYPATLLARLVTLEIEGEDRA
jgi:hypothetical protein